jgi:glycosyltransferase involved in cell wall biosynthesis
VKILLVNDYATATAGAEVLTLGLRDEFRRAGHETRVFASREQLVPGPSFADAHCFGSSGRMQTLSAMANPSAARALRRELAAFAPDAVQVQMFMWQLSPSILGALRGFPALLYSVVYRDICPTGTKVLPDGGACSHRAGVACLREGCVSAAGWVPRMVQQARWSRGRGAFTRTVACSHAVRGLLEEAGVAVDDVTWPGVPETDHCTAPGERPTVTYAGRLAREKGVDVLLRAFRLVLDGPAPGARLLVAGAGPDEQELRALAGRLELGDSVTWLGQLGPEEMAGSFAGAWVHAVPSVWPEPFGMTATEAMMRGTPAVVSATGGLTESVVHGATGLHVPPADAEALAGALGRLLSDRPLAERMGAAARTRALAGFGIGSCARSLLDHHHAMTEAAAA